ncbi:MAG: glutathionylspermidine synthase family protein [Betaproteobacteria bacterium]|nr:MAG: glutathionylspermidine synthase family protein [Betaproteobacteria bacterium]
MRRETQAPRANWRERCEAAGFYFHTIEGTPYWDESACYGFDADQVDRLEAVSGELHRLCLEAAAEVVRARRFAEFAIPTQYHDLVAESWTRGEPTLYGRFDFSWDGRGEPKLLEYNADTPTALLEASVVQWHWLEDTRAEADQFNSLHEKLIERWKALRGEIGRSSLHLACMKDSDEDFGTTEYLRDCALQAGWKAKPLYIEDLGWNGRRFVDLEDAPVEALFKLYPWEWLVRDEFGPHLLSRPMAMIEPAWKMLLSNKALLAVLWEMHYGHPNLLPAHLTPQRFASDYVRKPLLSREGANVMMRSRGVVREQPGSYGAEGFVYQGVAPLPEFGGRYPVIGSWIVGDAPAGMGIREDDSPITQNTSRFVPHYFT